MPKKSTTIKYYEATGRRKESVARVRLHIVAKKPVVFGSSKLGKGDFYINGKPLEEIYSHAHEKQQLFQPLLATDARERFAITVIVTGGGPAGQLQAIQHGLSRALVKVDDAFKAPLREHDLLTRDPRTRQRRNVGMGGKARRKKQSPKR